MQDHSRNRDESAPKKIWQNQPTEKSTMTLEMIRQRAQELHARTRRELYANITTTLIIVAISGFGFMHTRDWAMQFAPVVAVVWAVVGQYFLHRGMWAVTRPEDVALIAGLDFYRQEVNRRRTLFGRVLQWSLGPIILSIGALVLVLTGIAQNLGQSTIVIFPFCTIALMWIVAVFVLRSRSKRKLQREIDELNSIEKASGQ
jgi:hypothetical protein